MAVLKMTVLIVSLGLDTLFVSVSLGLTQVQKKFRIALTFACAEALMPLVGLFVGNRLDRIVGDWASVFGGVILLAIAVWLLFFEEDDDVEQKLKWNFSGWTLLITALSISLDELAVGFSIGLIGVPIAVTMSLIALQAFLFTFAGLAFGKKLSSYLGEWAEKFAGVVLGLLGIWIVIDAVVRFRS